ncbi:hypothetical protein [Amycolatopsis panacis]|uniref:hypothetical protein n=1 Tax=Amycolatopsis panacis TaxID=2340917 RepID=UPI0018F3904A|nr:hypothetical protein [Amycolatopsis panacis]
MNENRCPRCGWPLAELPASAVFPASPGSRADYVRCLCGSWLTRLAGVVVGATRSG